jgi:uncharacterized delta-60 repeat protein
MIYLVQPDGKIVAVGQTNALGTTDFALARYNTNGSLDTSFGSSGSGLVTTNFGSTSSDIALNAALQPDGRIVVAGQTNITGGVDFALARYLFPAVTISTLAEDIRAKYSLIPLE